MKLSDITSRTSAPVPWSEGDNIPWDDPDFSERMLKEHLSQEHDLASRRAVDRDIGSAGTAVASRLDPGDDRAVAGGIKNYHRGTEETEKRKFCDFCTSVVKIWRVARNPS